MQHAEQRRITSQAWLRNLLANGPMNRLDVLACAEASGYSEKVLRTAREAIGVVTARSGNAATGIGSTWALPGGKGTEGSDPRGTSGDEAGTERLGIEGCGTEEQGTEGSGTEAMDTDGAGIEEASAAAAETGDAPDVGMEGDAPGTEGFVAGKDSPVARDQALPRPPLSRRGQSLSPAADRLTASAAAPQVATTSGRRPQRFADHPRSRDIDSLAGEELREYCRRIGMSGRDARELPEDRLRAGAKSHLANYFEALLE